MDTMGNRTGRTVANRSEAHQPFAESPQINAVAVVATVVGDRIPAPGRHFAMKTVWLAMTAGLFLLPLAATADSAASTWEDRSVEGTWVQQAVSPEARTGHAMAYDSTRQRTVLFGEYYNKDGWPNVLGDTWEWDGATWTPVATMEEGPSARFGHAMAYDSTRQRTVLFGGYDRTNQTDLQGDTWLWDGSEWTEVATSGPSPEARAGHAMVYDSARERTVLFGGYDSHSNHLDDTWEWDGTTWTRVATTGPSARRDVAMIYDSARQRTVLFGGNHMWDAQFFGDTWEWDGTTWTRVATTGPEGRDAHAMAYDSARDRTVLFGGGKGTRWPFGDTWEWDGTVWTQSATVAPEPRIFHAMAYDSARQRTVLFGGNTLADEPHRTDKNDTWEWDGTAWTQKIATPPEPRFLHAMAYDSARQRTVLFGGLGKDSWDNYAFYDDTWEWDGSDWIRKSVPGARPSPRNGHAMVFDSTRQITVLFLRRNRQR